MASRIQMANQLAAEARARVGYYALMPAKERAAAVAQAQALRKGWQKTYDSVTDPAQVPADFAYLYPQFLALTATEAEEARVDKSLAALVRQLPVWSAWGEGVVGFGPGSLGAIVGECGDLSTYSNPAKLWKRMGVGIVQGQAQRRVANADLAIAMGYCMRRRVILYAIGANFIRLPSCEYRRVYDERKRFEIAKAEAAGLKVAPAAKIPKAKAAQYMSDGHIHRRAQRYMEKRLLRDLWRAWTGRGRDFNATEAA